MTSHHAACIFVWICLMLSAATLPIDAAMVAQDSGTNYTTDTWVDGATAGTGFSVWTFSSTGPRPPSDFTVIENSIFNGGGANIGTSFGLKGATLDKDVTSGRSFLEGPLSDNQTFSADMVVNFRGGFKGISLKSGDSDIAMLHIADDDYQFNRSDISGLSGAQGDWGYHSNTILHFSATVVGSDLHVNITRTGGLSATYSTILIGMSGNLDNFSFFSNSTPSDAENNIYLNNLSVVPEPTELTMLGLGAATLSTLRSRRRVIRL